MEHDIKEITEKIIKELNQEKLTLRECKQILEKAEEKAVSMGVPMVISLVDEGGNLLALHRMDDSLLASISVSQSKAYTALALRSPTEETARSILPGQALHSLSCSLSDRFCSIGGGVPIIRQGCCIGGLGVSGGTPDQDVRVANYAITP